MIRFRYRIDLKRAIAVQLPFLVILVVGLGIANPALGQLPRLHRYLYVAAPGIRNYLDYGGHGLLVFDMDNNFRFVKRIAFEGLDSTGNPANVKGIAVSTLTHCIYISTIPALICIDLLNDHVVWEKPIAGGCDRLSISPDGSTIYLPSFEGDDWKVLDARNGNVLHTIVTRSASHNTLYAQDGKKVYLEGLKSNYLKVSNAKNHQVESQVGPFSNHVRPFTIDAKQKRCFVNVDSLLGFEVGDLRTMKKIRHVEVEGFYTGAVKRHGCPSHGIALSPDEQELWLADGHNEAVHIFDISKEEITQAATVKLRDQPGWITFSIDGHYGIPSTGEIIDPKTRTIIARLTDETGAAVQSEKMIEVQFAGKKLVKAGDQFGIGRGGK